MQVLETVKEYVTTLFKNQKMESMYYHNYRHTLDVVEATKTIAEGVGLSNEEIELVIIAAWFHDTGYLCVYKGHEEESVRIAVEFLETIDFDKNKVAVITSTILATRYPQQPKNLLEEVLCDADLGHLGKDGYLERSNDLRREWESIGQSFDNVSWIENDINFLSGHSYHTEFATQLYSTGKNNNSELLKRLRITAKTSQKDKGKK